MDAALGMYPPIISTLAKIPGSWAHIHNYLNIIIDSDLKQFQTLTIEFAQAFSIAQLNLPGSKFTRQI